MSEQQRVVGMTMTEGQKAVGACLARLLRGISESRKEGLNSETVLERLVIEIAGQFGAFLACGGDSAEPSPPAPADAWVGVA